MRGRSLISAFLAAATLVGAAAPAGAIRNRGGRTVSVTPKGKKGATIKVTVSKPRTATQTKPVVTCRRRRVTVTVNNGTLPAGQTGIVQSQSVVQIWRQCFRISDGRPTGPERLIDDGFGSDDIYELEVPDPRVFTEAAGNRWFAQRIGYVWIDPTYWQDFRVPVMRGGRQAGWAAARPIEVVFDPGVGGGSSVQCDDDAALPYDPAIAHWYQPKVCSYTYFVSSRYESGQAYRARVWVRWEVVATLDNGDVVPIDPRESETVVPIRVEEIQSLVACRGRTAESCQ